MKTRFYLLMALGFFSGSLPAQDYLVSTPNTSLLINATPGEKVKTQYYGSKIEPRDIQGIYDTEQPSMQTVIPLSVFIQWVKKAMAVTFPRW